MEERLPPAEAQARARLTRWMSRGLRRESRGLRRAAEAERRRSGEVGAYVRGCVHGLGALYRLGDVEELADVTPLLELVEREPPKGKLPAEFDDPGDLGRRDAGRHDLDRDLM